VLLPYPFDFENGCAWCGLADRLPGDRYCAGCARRLAGLLDRTAAALALHDLAVG
jgi:hypothetical protein